MNSSDRRLRGSVISLSFVTVTHRHLCHIVCSRESERGREYILLTYPLICHIYQHHQFHPRHPQCCFTNLYQSITTLPNRVRVLSIPLLRSIKSINLCLNSSILSVLGSLEHSILQHRSTLLHKLLYSTILYTIFHKPQVTPCRLLVSPTLLLTTSYLLPLTYPYPGRTQAYRPCLSNRKRTGTDYLQYLHL